MKKKAVGRKKKWGEKTNGQLFVEKKGILNYN